MDKYRIPYLNMIVRKFAERYSLTLQNAFEYLLKFGGMKYLIDFYEIEHTLPIEDTLDELAATCCDGGGSIK